MREKYVTQVVPFGQFLSLEYSFEIWTLNVQSWGTIESYFSLPSLKKWKVLFSSRNFRVTSAYAFRVTQKWPALSKNDVLFKKV